MNNHQKINEIKGKTLSLTNMTLPAHLDRLLVNLTVNKHDKSLELLSLIKKDLSELEELVLEIKKLDE